MAMCNCKMVLDERNRVEGLMSGRFARKVAVIYHHFNHFEAPIAHGLVLMVANLVPGLLMMSSVVDWNP